MHENIDRKQLQKLQQCKEKPIIYYESNYEDDQYLIIVNRNTTLGMLNRLVEFNSDASFCWSGDKSIFYKKLLSQFFIVR